MHDSTPALRPLLPLAMISVLAALGGCDAESTSSNAERPAVGGKADGAEGLDESPVCSLDGWCAQSARTVRNDARAVLALGSGEVRVVGTAMTTWRVLEGGDMTAEVGENDETFRDLWESPNGEVWAVASKGRIYRDSGEGWALVATPTDRDLVAIWGSSANDIWVAADSQVFRGDGAQWTPITTGYTLIGIKSIAGTSAQDVHIAADHTIARWNGATWSVPPMDYFLFYSNDLWFSRKGDGFAATSKGIMRWDADTESWKVGPSPAPGSPVERLAGNDLDTLWAVGHWRAKVWRFDAAAQQWAEQTSIRDLEWTAIDVADDGEVWIAGEGALARVDGEHYEELIGDEKSLFNDGWGTLVANEDQSRVYAVGSRIDELTGGFPSEEIPSDTLTQTTHAWATGDELWVLLSSPVSGPGSVARYVDGVWSELLTVDRPLGAVGGSSPDDVWVGGAKHYNPSALGPLGGEVLHFDGTTWTSHELPWETIQWAWSRPDIGAITARDVDDVWAVGQMSMWFAVGPGAGCSGQWPAFFHYDGSQWVAIESGGEFCDLTLPPMRAVWAAGPGEAWAAGGNMIYHLGRDGVIANYALPRWVQLTGITGYANDDIYVSGEKAIYHFDGIEWTEQQAGAGVWMNDVLALPDRVVAIGSNMSILQRRRP